jgi:hypothetical protein
MATAGLALPTIAKAIPSAVVSLPVGVPASCISPGAAQGEDMGRSKHLNDSEEVNHITELTRIGKGAYARPRMKKVGEKRELRYDFHFEEMAPGRNSAANEWSAYGVTGGNNAFNTIGRDMRVRYPAYDLVFRLYEGDKEICPGDLVSFRLGLVRDHLPAIWGEWVHDGLRYKVSVMAVPSDERGNAYDLYKIEIQNTTEELFARETQELKASLYKSFQQTFRRTGLYEGYMWFGVEKESESMYGFWGHAPLVWPARAIDPHDPMLTATFRKMERMANQWGAGLYSDAATSSWPYGSVDWAISYILRGEPDKTLAVFCAFTDTAGLTYSWSEFYHSPTNTTMGDQPHGWADAQWLALYRHLFVMENGSTLLLTPATLRRWQQGDKPIKLVSVPTHFGYLDLTVEPRPDGSHLDYQFKLDPKGDQASRTLDKIVVDARTSCGRKIKRVSLNGQSYENFFNEQVLIPQALRNKEYRLQVDIE